MAQSSYFNPRRNEIRTLERNIISYRALQMVLALHYAEEIKRVVIDAIRMTDKWRIFPAAIDAVERIPKGTPRPFEKALKIFVSEGAITSNQASEIGKLVDYRNDIAHRANELMADMSNSDFIQGIINIDDLSFASYDYHAAQKMKSYLEVIRETSDRIFISSLSFSDHMFETAEKALQIDLKRLKRKIDRQFSRRISETKALKEQLRKISIEFGDQKSLCHPANNYPNGKLTLRGKEICYRLFDRGFSTLTIAYAMRMSLTAIRRRKKKWEELGGSHRPSVHFSARPLRQAQRSAKNG